MPNLAGGNFLSYLLAMKRKDTFDKHL